MRQQFYDEEDDTFLGDEELEEGYRTTTQSPRQEEEPRPTTTTRPTLGERRLSRELEAGFRDDSDSDTEARRASRAG